MATTKAKKEEVLKDLEEKLGRAEAVYFADYRGLSVKDMGKLRGKLREEGYDFRIAKKTLMQLSLKNQNMPEAPAEVMQGPVGAAFSYDGIVSAVKALHEFSKENDNLKILGGLVEGKFITQAEAVELAKMPTREELLAKLVGSMKAPVSGFYGVTSGLLRNLVYVLKAVEEKKPEEAAPAEEPKEEKPVEEAKTEEKPAEEAAPEEKKEEVKEEAKTEEAPAEEKQEEPKEEAKAEEEKPAEDEKKDEKADEESK